MPINEATRKILEDMRRAGLDTSSLENQLAVNPLAQQQANAHLGGGILRQSEYTRYMNEAVRRSQEVERQAQQLASLHDARDTTQLPKETLETIDALEKALIDSGEFDAESIRTISNKGRHPASLQARQSDPNTNLNNNPNQSQNPNNVRNSNGNGNGAGLYQPNTVDTSKFVDADTLQAFGANLAYGSIASNLEISAALEDLKGLGIPVTRDSIKKLQENLRKSYESGKDLDHALEETYKVSEVRTTKAKEALDKQLADAEARGRAAALRENGILPERNTRFPHRNHMILDRKSANKNVPAPSENGNKDPNKDGQNITAAEREAVESGNKGKEGTTEVPKNKYGDPEVFRERGTREGRVARAAVLSDQVMEHLSNDITYTGD